MTTSMVPPRPCRLRKSVVSKFAEGVASELGFEIGAPMEPLVESIGGRIFVGHSQDDEAEGGSIIARDFDDFDIFLSSYTAPIRDRFTLAHELGHLALHLDILKQDDPGAIMRATRWVDNNDPEQKRAEWEANWFAAAFLMPAEPFLDTFEESGATVTAARFNVSKKAAEIRFQTLTE